MVSSPIQGIGIWVLFAPQSQYPLKEVNFFFTIYITLRVILGTKRATDYSVNAPGITVSRTVIEQE